MCFHGNDKKEVNLIHVLQSIKLGGPYQVLAVCKYAIVLTTLRKTCLDITKTFFVIYLATPPTFNVYKCYYIKLNLLILLESY